MRTPEFWISFVLNGKIRRRGWRVTVFGFTHSQHFPLYSPLIVRAEIQSVVERRYYASGIQKFLELSDFRLERQINNQLESERLLPPSLGRVIVGVERGPDHPLYVR